MNIQISTAMGCINNCKICPQKTLVSAYGKISKTNTKMMSFYTFKTIINKVPKKTEIMFCGMCEPFQNPKCTKMIIYAHQKGHKVRIFTTLVGLNLKNLKQIFSCIPFNGKQTDFLVHLPSLENIENIVINDSYLKVLKYLVATDKNIEFHYHGNKINPQIGKIITNSKYSLYHDPIHNRAGHINFTNSINPKRKRGHIACYCWGYIFFPDGSVTLCTNDYGLKYPLGNILTSSYKQIDNHPNVKLIKKALKNDKIETLCRYCPNSYNINGVAEFYNTPFSLSKIPLGLKIFLFNYAHPLYSTIRQLKFRFFKSSNQKINNLKYKEWLAK